MTKRKFRSGWGQSLRVLAAMLFVLGGLLAFAVPTGGATPSSNGLAAHWGMDEGSGSTIYDDSGNNLSGNFTEWPAWTQGVHGGGLVFDGHDYINIGNVTAINGKNQATLAGWMKRSYPNARVMLGKQTSTAHDFTIELWDDGWVYFQVSNGNWAAAYVYLNDTAWHHYALVFDGTATGNQNRLKAYIDGVQQNLQFYGNFPATTTSNTTPFRIGRMQNDYSSGTMDDVWLYSRSLSGTEVNDLMDGPETDAEAPSVPQNVQAQAVSQTQANVTWSASTDNVGVIGYRVYRNGASVGTTTTTAFADSGLAAATTYTYTVEAYDLLGNTSAQSAPVQVTTQSPPPLPSVTLAADPASLEAGTGSILTWTVTDAVSCTASGSWSGSKALSGNEQTGVLTATAVYELTCNGPGGQVSAQASVTVADTVAPSVPVGLSSQNVTQQSAQLAWTASSDVVGVVGYKVYRDGAEVATVSTTSYEDTSLAPETGYDYTVTAFDAAGNASAQSTVLQVTTLPVPPLPTVSLTTDVAEVVSGGSVTLNWSSTDATNCNASGSWSGSKALSGSEQFNNLQQAETYTISCTGPGGLAEATANVAITPACRDGLDNDSDGLFDGDDPGCSDSEDTDETNPDVTAPIVPANLQVTNTALDSISLEWDASTDNVGVSGYRVFRDGAELTQVSGTSFTDNGLQASTTYTYTVAAYDAAGNQSAISTEAVATTLAPPPVPTISLGADAAGVASGGSVTLSWNSSDAANCTASGSWSGSKALSGSEQISNITAAMNFVLTCTGPGGQAETSVAVSVLPACSDNTDNDNDGLTDGADPGCSDANDNDETDPDTQAPSVPAGLSATAVSATQADVSWQAATDNFGVTGYRLFRDGVAVTTVTGTVYSDTALSAGTTYAYTVTAYDAAGNESAQSSPVQVTTAAVGSLTNGPLRKSATNGRYFVDASGKARFLAGSHTWSNMQDYSILGTTDYEDFLDHLSENGHNFFRLWAHEQASGFQGYAGVTFTPTPYLRPGPGTALDGQPKFDLDQFNQAYFDRMRDRIIQARERGIYVSVMFFNGWNLDLMGQSIGNPCEGHPLNGSNNVNGVNAAQNGSCRSAHTLQNAAVTQRQEAYVSKIIDTVNDLDNVMYEISNESDTTSTAWQYHMIDYVKQQESARPFQHMVGMTVQYPGGNNSTVFNSDADWVSPNGTGGYDSNPPVATGSKVVIVDSDHIWGIGGDYTWVWKNVMRGNNVLYMDCYNVFTDVCTGIVGSTAYNQIVPNLGYARELLDRADLVNMTPQGSLASTGYALAKTGMNAEILVYRQSGRSVNVNLSGMSGSFVTEWLNPRSGQVITGTVQGGATRSISSSFSGTGVLYIHR